LPALPGAAAVEALSPAAAGAAPIELLSAVADASVVALVAAVLLALSLLVLLHELRASRQAPSRGKVERSIVLRKRFDGVSKLITKELDKGFAS